MSWDIFQERVKTQTGVYILILIQASLDKSDSPGIRPQNFRPIQRETYVTPSQYECTEYAPFISVCCLLSRTRGINSPERQASVTEPHCRSHQSPLVPRGSRYFLLATSARRDPLQVYKHLCFDEVSAGRNRNTMHWLTYKTGLPSAEICHLLFLAVLPDILDA